MAAPQAPPSLGFSRQEHWRGLPFPSPTGHMRVRKLHVRCPLFLNFNCKNRTLKTTFSEKGKPGHRRKNTAHSAPPFQPHMGTPLSAWRISCQTPLLFTYQWTCWYLDKIHSTVWGCFFFRHIFFPELGLSCLYLSVAGFSIAHCILEVLPCWNVCNSA